MARKEAIVVIEKEGRDKDKAFKLTELSARRVEDWAVRAFSGMARAGATVPEDVRNAGIAGIAIMGATALFSMSYHDAKPLLDEMLDCVKLIPNPSAPKITRDLLEDDIEEVATLLQLRKEVLDLHINFSELVSRFNLKLPETPEQDQPSETT